MTRFAAIEDWPYAARLTAGARLLADAKTYGFVDGGPNIDVDRCDDLLAEAARRGVVVTQAEATEAALALLGEINARDVAHEAASEVRA